MKIVECDESYREAWNDFVGQSPDASFYHRFEWREVNTTCFNHRACYLAALEGQRITGIFPIVQVKTHLFGNIACSLPFVNYGGPCSESEEVEGALMAEASQVVDRWRVDYLEIRSRKRVGNGLATSEHKVSMTVDLDPDPDRLWKAFKTGQRQEIRRAYKNGFSARLGGEELFDDFYKVLAESWRNLGTPILSRHYLQTVTRVFAGSIRICVVYAGSEPAAAALDGRHRGTVEGMWLGARARYREQLAGYVLYWELLKDACLSGSQRFHLGRSTSQSGGETFKKKWNAYPTQLYWQYLLRTVGEIPQLNITNPRYQLAIRAWRKLPVLVTRVIGPAIARSIP